MVAEDVARLRVAFEQQRAGLEQQWIRHEAAVTQRSLDALVPPEDRRRYPDLDVLDPYFLATASRQTALGGLLEAILERSAADMGDVQLCAPNRLGLYIAEHRGLERPFLDYFAWVDGQGSACAVAASRRKAVIVPDVAHSPVFTEESRQVMMEARARAVSSVPLRDAAGSLLGSFSVQYRKARWPREEDLRLLASLSRVASRYLMWHGRQTGDGMPVPPEGDGPSAGRSRPTCHPSAPTPMRGHAAATTS